MNFIRKLFCKHKNSEVICWHWTHGPNGNDIRFFGNSEEMPRMRKVFLHLHKKLE